MHAHETRGGVAHGIFVQRKRVMQHVAPQHRGNDFAAIQTVAIDFAAGGPASVEVRAHFLGGHNANRGRQQRVQRAVKFGSGKSRLRAKAADLAQRVDAGVGAPGAVELHIFLRDAAQHVHDFALDGRFVCLNLPAVEVRAVVGDGELEITHPSEELSVMPGGESSGGARRYMTCG